MTPTVGYLALALLAVAGLVVGAVLLNVPLLATALGALAAIAGLLAFASRRVRR